MNDALFIPGILIVVGAIAYQTLSSPTPSEQEILQRQQVVIEQQQQRIQELQAEQRGMLMNR